MTVVLMNRLGLTNNQSRKGSLGKVRLQDRPELSDLRYY